VARFEASWSLPAIVRLGDISFFAGQKLLEAPVPKEITRLDEQYPDQGVLANYQTALEEQVQPNTDAARDQWLKALQTAKTAGVANAWSKLASQRLNSYIAADLYPTQRDELIDREVQEVNKQLASYESVKYFRILPRDFSQEAGELTPSLKVKRKVVTERYRDTIEEMYRS